MTAQDITDVDEDILCGYHTSRVSEKIFLYAIGGFVKKIVSFIDRVLFYALMESKHLQDFDAILLSGYRKNAKR